MQNHDSCGHKFGKYDNESHQTYVLQCNATRMASCWSNKTEVDNCMFALGFQNN